LGLSVYRFLVSFRNDNAEALNLKVLHLLIELGFGIWKLVVGIS
jgi:hypothetical protein